VRFLIFLPGRAPPPPEGSKEMRGVDEVFAKAVDEAITIEEQGWTAQQPTGRNNLQVRFLIFLPGRAPPPPEGMALARLLRLLRPVGWPDTDHTRARRKCRPAYGSNIRRMQQQGDARCGRRASASTSGRHGAGAVVAVITAGGLLGCPSLFFDCDSTPVFTSILDTLSPSFLSWPDHKPGCFVGLLSRSPSRRSNQACGPAKRERKVKGCREWK
jgi:hypothetical protein